MTRRTFLGTAMCAAAASAQTNQARGKELIEKTIHALGGDAFRNMTTKTETGRAYSFYREELSGLSIARISTKYLPDDKEGPLHAVQRQVFGKKMDDTVIFTRKEAWEITYRGAKPLPETRFKTFQDSMLHDSFYILRMRINEPGMVFESRGSDVVENRPVNIIDMFDAENRKVTLWIHSSTFLPVKQQFQRWDNTVNDRREEVTRFSKYRDVGNGIMLPYDTQRERDGEKIFELYADEVKTGEDMPQSLFELPAGVTILKR
jgi:hypothetical protein